MVLIEGENTMVKRRTKNRRRYNKKKNKVIIGLILTLCLLGVTVFVIFRIKLYYDREKTTDILTEYMNCIPQKDYEKMYSMLDKEKSISISQEDFIVRNSAIYEGIELQNLKVETIEYDKERLRVKYRTTFDTVAGQISFENAALFNEGEEGYKLIWHDALIFPELESSDKVRISRIAAKIGKILDRNDGILAGIGTASSVGIVPGKLKNRETAIPEIAELLEIKPESIEKKLEAKWIKRIPLFP